jgi:hypothetical protein
MTKMMGTGGFHLIDVYITNSIWWWLRF